jgi:threonine/homoserine/homoserine lactone efflux protein
MSGKFILIYSLTVFVASIAPGPSMLLALNHGIRYGMKRTIASALGNNLATFLQALLTIAGLGTLLLHSQSLFNMIKLLGAVYLVSFGINMFFSPNKGLQAPTGRMAKTKTGFGLFAEAFVVTMANPKAILFFTALFPQFVTTEKETFFQFFMIVFVLLVIAFGCMMIYGFFGLKIARLLKESKIRKGFNRMVGTAFIAMGIGLAWGRD